MSFARRLAHFLLPHESNNHKAKLIQPSGLLLILSFFLVFQSILGLGKKLSPRVLGYAANISPNEVIRLTNEKRIENGFPPLVENPILSRAAQAKAADMLNFDYWAHVSPSGTQPWKFFTDVGYKYKYAGENLARDFSDPASTVNAWMASPSHRENLLSNKYKEIGVAVVEGDMGGVDTTIVVQFFGTRFADTLPIEPVAAAESNSPGLNATPFPSPSSEPVSHVQTSGSTRVLISPFNATKNVSAFVIVTLLAILIVDMAIVARKKIVRISGRSLAQFAFLGMILAIVVIAKAGKIL